MEILISILLVVIGLSTGVAASIVFNNAKENNNNEEPQYEINLPALLISFLKCFSFLL